MGIRNWVITLRLLAELGYLKRRGVISRFRCEDGTYDLDYTRKPTIASLSVECRHVRVLLEGEGMTSVTASPHYSFVVGHLSGRDEMKDAWRRYFKAFYDRGLLLSRETAFIALIEEAKTGNKLREILVRKDRRGTHFVVIDGLHRLSIHSVLSPTQEIDCYLAP